ncbi:MAG: alternative ribosome rescue aminoacyl-tRNA hydrolase ArfB [Pseudomonadota bacterium]
MIKVSETLWLDEKLIQIKFIRASGPGGQNVNKVASAVQLRFNVGACLNLNQAQKARLKRLAGQRMSEAGLLTIDARRFRTQDRNREDALDRLINLVQRAEKPPPPRKKTKPGPAAKARRLEEKRQRSNRKRNRQAVAPED